jgi:hypothetical protein
MWYLIGGIVLYVLVMALICLFFAGAKIMRGEG